MSLDFFVFLIIAVALGVYIGLHPEVFKTIFIIAVASIVLFMVASFISGIGAGFLFSILFITIIYYFFFKMVVYDNKNKTIRIMGNIATVLWIILLFSAVVGTFGGFFKTQ